MLYNNIQKKKEEAEEVKTKAMILDMLQETFSDNMGNIFEGMREATGIVKITSLMEKFIDLVKENITEDEDNSGVYDQIVSLVKVIQSNESGNNKAGAMKFAKILEKEGLIPHINQEKQLTDDSRKQKNR